MDWRGLIKSLEGQFVIIIVFFLIFLFVILIYLSFSTNTLVELKPILPENTKVCTRIYTINNSSVIYRVLNENKEPSIQVQTLSYKTILIQAQNKTLYNCCIKDQEISSLPAGNYSMMEVLCNEEPVYLGEREEM